MPETGLSGEARVLSSIVPKDIFNLQKALERSIYRDAARHRSNSRASYSLPEVIALLAPVAYRSVEVPIAPGAGCR